MGTLRFVLYYLWNGKDVHKLDDFKKFIVVKRLYYFESSHNDL